MQFQAVIFDMDGVIIDSHQVALKELAKAANWVGASLTEEIVKSWGSLDSVQFWTKVKTEYRLDSEVEELIDGYDKAAEVLAYKSIGPEPGIMEFMQALKNLGVRMAIATSGRAYRVNVVIEMFRLDRFIETWVGSDHVMNSKPAPDVFIEAARRLNCQPQKCLVIEDSENGIRAAKAAGMTCFGYSRRGENWENLQGADTFFDSFDELGRESFK